MTTGELPFLAVDGPKSPPLRYHGSKWRIAPWVISHMPAHKNYVEVFGGGASVLIRKSRSATEIYNDLDENVVNFFRMLRDPETREQIVEAIALTPYSRQEFKESMIAAANPIEKARRFVFYTFAGFGSNVDLHNRNGFRSVDSRAGRSYGIGWTKVPDSLIEVADRLLGVTIEHLDFRRLIPKFHDKETLLYADPPYPWTTRSIGGKGYLHEMCDEDHRQLAWMLHKHPGPVLISGYQCGLYEGLYKDWRCDTKSVSASGRSGGTSRTECLWMNFDQ